MRNLWLYYLPLLFLPNFGFETATPFGTLTMADYLIVPYLILVFVGSRPNQEDRFSSRAKLYVDFLIPTLLIFFWWAVISTLTISFRYDYPDFNPVTFSLLKLGKLFLYGLAAVLTIHALSKLGREGHQKFLWSVLVSGLVVGITLLISGNSLTSILPSLTQNQQVFQENPVSVMISILIAFLVGMLVQGQGTVLWRRSTLIGLLIMVLGFVAAEGRGGWVAALAAMIYLGSQINVKQIFRLVLVSAVLLLFIYNQNTAFRALIDRTLNPDPIYLETYNVGVAGLDDGGRLSIFLAEAPRILQDSLLGRGFFHRGGLSGIFYDGSHNFFLQMFLETGIIGGTLILVLFRQMWRHASSHPAITSRLALPVKAALVAAFVSGMSGEYFYGGMVFFAFFLAYAPVGSLLTEKETIVFPATASPHRVEPTRG